MYVEVHLLRALCVRVHQDSDNNDDDDWDDDEIDDDRDDVEAHLLRALCVRVHQAVEEEDVRAGCHLGRHCQEEVRQDIGTLMNPSPC